MRPLVDYEQGILSEVQAWMAAHGFDEGETDHQLVLADGSVEAVLDLAWPRGLQVEFSEPVALLLNEPLEVYQAAVRHGYRPFTTRDELRSYALDLETLGLAETAAA